MTRLVLPAFCSPIRLSSISLWKKRLQESVGKEEPSGAVRVQGRAATGWQQAVAGLGERAAARERWRETVRRSWKAITRVCSFTAAQADTRACLPSAAGGRRLPPPPVAAALAQPWPPARACLITNPGCAGFGSAQAALQSVLCSLPPSPAQPFQHALHPSAHYDCRLLSGAWTRDGRLGRGPATGRRRLGAAVAGWSTSWLARLDPLGEAGSRKLAFAFFSSEVAGLLVTPALLLAPPLYCSSWRSTCPQCRVLSAGWRSGRRVARPPPRCASLPVGRQLELWLPT